MSTTHAHPSFSLNEQVEVTHKADCDAWHDHWVEPMDKTIGQVGHIIAIDEYGIRVDFGGTNWVYPPCALKSAAAPAAAPAAPAQATSPAAPASPASAPAATPAPAKPKAKRRRIGPGPWDQAPCTHLRWNLMGFFRERLALVKAKVKVPNPLDPTQSVEVEVAAAEVVCTKCGTKMTLQGK